MPATPRLRRPFLALRHRQHPPPDVIRQRQQTEADRSRLVTLSQAAALFLQSRRLAATTLAGFQWSLDRHFPDWLDRPLAEITRRDAFEKHKLLTKKHGPYGANGAHGGLAAF